MSTAYENLKTYLAADSPFLEFKKRDPEEVIQETLPFEDETTVAGKKYPLLVMPSGLFVYKDEIPPQEKSPDLNPDHKLVLFVPNKNKKSGKIIKMHPMTGVAIRSKTL